MKHILGFSGGIDSQACARWLLNRYPADDVVLTNSDAGGNEDPMTTEFLHAYSRDVHPVVMISAIVGDLGRSAIGARTARGLSDDAPLTFDLLAELKGIFPSRKRQFCTEFLKLRPQLRWIKANMAGIEFRRYSGVRRQESGDRAKRQPVEWDDCFGCELFHPLIDWTKQMCFDYVQHHHEQINPLYTLGFGRVGCAPCVNSNKGDILNWVQRRPDAINKVRDWEKRVGRTFFAPIVPGMALNWIDDVVRWAKTEHGGKQFGLKVLYEPATCESDYGLCE